LILSSIYLATALEKGQQFLISVRIDQQIETIKRDGFTIINNLLSEREVTSIRSELSPYLQKEKFGRNDFEGFSTERVYALLNKAPMISKIVEHQVILELLDCLLPKNYLLSAALAINVHPGETPQPFHRDDTSRSKDFSQKEQLNGVSTIWAIDDFTEKNGATELIRASHLVDAANPDLSRLAKACMPSGSVLIFDGRLQHRGGANLSLESRLGITPQYCAPHLRQIESMLLAVPPQTATNFSERIQEMLGYSINDPGFMGYVDGRHPKQLIDPKYKGRKYRPDLPSS